MLPVKRNLLPTVSRFFDDDWNSVFDWTNHNYLAATLPAVNIRETGDEYILEMAAPGMKKDDFQIELHNSLLSIKREMMNETETDSDAKYTLQEFRYQSFQRSFSFNNRVADDAEIKAMYQDGILTVVLPKKEEAREKPTRRIEIS